MIVERFEAEACVCRCADVRVRQEGEEEETDLGLVAHEPLGDGVHRVEDQQLSDSCTTP